MFWLGSAWPGAAWRGNASRGSVRFGLAFLGFPHLPLFRTWQLTLSELVKTAWSISEDKGFHSTIPEHANFGNRIALIHGELFEAHEEYRNGRGFEPRVGPTGKPEGVPSELADVVIRVADLCGVHGIDLQSAVETKLAYNRTRPFRHGRNF